MAFADRYAFLSRDLAAVDRSATPHVVFSGHRPMYASSTVGEASYGNRFVANNASFNWASRGTTTTYSKRADGWAGGLVFDTVGFHHTHTYRTVAFTTRTEARVARACGDANKTTSMRTVGLAATEQDLNVSWCVQAMAEALEPLFQQHGVASPASLHNLCACSACSPPGCCRVRLAWFGLVWRVGSCCCLCRVLAVQDSGFGCGPPPN